MVTSWEDIASSFSEWEHDIRFVLFPTLVLTWHVAMLHTRQSVQSSDRFDNEIFKEKPFCLKLQLFGCGG